MRLSGPTTDDEEALQKIRALCQALPGAEETQLQDRPLFRVGNRRFALFNGTDSPPRRRWAGCGRSLHFLSDASEVDALRQDARFSLSPHHGHRGWLALRLDEGDVDWSEIQELLHSAYRQVAGRASRGLTL